MFLDDKNYQVLISDDNNPNLNVRPSMFNWMIDDMTTCFNKLINEKEPKLMEARHRLHSALNSFENMRAGRPMINRIRYYTVKKEITRAFRLVNEVITSENLPFNKNKEDTDPPPENKDLLEFMKKPNNWMSYD